MTQRRMWTGTTRSFRSRNENRRKARSWLTRLPRQRSGASSNTALRFTPSSPAPYSNTRKQGGRPRRCGRPAIAHSCNPEESRVNSPEVKKRTQPTGKETPKVCKRKEGHRLAETGVQARRGRFDVVRRRKIGYLDCREKCSVLIKLWTEYVQWLFLHSMTCIRPCSIIIKKRLNQITQAP